MPHLTIKVVRKNQTEPAFPEITEENFGGDLSIEGAAILEHGMASGKPSIGFSIKGPDGKYYMAQTSADILRSLVSALDGAEGHWRDNPL